MVKLFLLALSFSLLTFFLLIGLGFLRQGGEVNILGVDQYSADAAFFVEVPEDVDSTLYPQFLMENGAVESRF